MDACDLDPDALAEEIRRAREGSNGAKGTGGNERANSAEGGKEWPEPELAYLDTRRTKAPVCPLDVFGPWRAWIEEQAEVASSPVDYVAVNLLAAVGATIANLRWACPWPGWREPPVLNVGCVGSPSSGKSPGQDAVTAGLRDAEKRLAETFPERHREWQRDAEAAAARAALWRKEVKAAAEAGEAPPDLPEDAIAPPEPKRPRLFTTDATMEAAALLLRDEPKGLLLIRDELAGWIGGLDKYGGEGAERAFWIEAYGGRAKVVDRVKFDGVPLFVPHLSIGIAGTIQPDRLASMILTGDDDGLAARFILVWPEPVPLVRPKAKPGIGRLTTALVRLRRLRAGQDEKTGESCPLAVLFAEEAAAALHEFRVEIRERERDAAGLFLSHMGKWPGLAARLALIFEHLWWAAEGEDGDRAGPSRISERAARAGIGFVAEYVQPMARRVYGEAALPKEERDAATLARWLAGRARAPEGLPETVRTRTIQRERLPGLRTAEEVKAALAELQEGGWVRPVPNAGGPGRPAGDWQLNPKLRGALR